MVETAPRMARADVDTAAQKLANSLVSLEIPLLLMRCAAHHCPLQDNIVGHSPFDDSSHASGQ
jgi:hypothetical protein